LILDPQKRNERYQVMKIAFALSTAVAITLSVSGAAYSQQQLKALTVKSYVLTDPDGTPRYLVQYSEESNFRQVYNVHSAKSVSSSPPKRAERSRRPASKKRRYWPSEVM
jgi:hypothetical protein